MLEVMTIHKSVQLLAQILKLRILLYTDLRK